MTTLAWAIARSFGEQFTAVDVVAAVSHKDSKYVGPYERGIIRRFRRYGYIPNESRVEQIREEVRNDFGGLFAGSPPPLDSINHLLTYYGARSFESDPPRAACAVQRWMHENLCEANERQTDQYREGMCRLAYRALSAWGADTTLSDQERVVAALGCNRRNEIAEAYWWLGSWSASARDISRHRRLLPDPIEESEGKSAYFQTRNIAFRSRRVVSSSLILAAIYLLAREHVPVAFQNLQEFLQSPTLNSRHEIRQAAPGQFRFTSVDATAASSSESIRIDTTSNGWSVAALFDSVGRRLEVRSPNEKKSFCADSPEIRPGSKYVLVAFSTESGSIQYDAVTVVATADRRWQIIEGPNVDTLGEARQVATDTGYLS